MSFHRSFIIISIDDKTTEKDNVFLEEVFDFIERGKKEYINW